MGAVGYWVKMDVRKCFPSTDQGVAMRLYERLVASADVLYLIGALMSTYGSGLNIGSYFSQYTANLLMSQAYHFVEGLGKERRGRHVPLIAHQLWYMDDVLLMSRGKRDLAKAARALEGYMADDLGYELKPWQVMVVGEPLTMVGYTMTPGKTIVRDATFLKARRAFARFSRDPGNLALARRVASYSGIMMQADTYGWRRDNGAAETLRIASDLISESDRRRNASKGSMLG